MSGGVDSSVAAALLKEQGYDVAGATIRVWTSPRCGSAGTNACCGVSGIQDARAVARKLGIPYHVFDFEKAFKTEVVDRFAAEYQKGRTPNPCISCNEHIKFTRFLARAREMGYEKIATGHFAKLVEDPEKQVRYLTESADSRKDQTYVLFPLSQDVLQNLLLPLGDMTKPEVRALARKLELPVMNKPESQEICFVPKDDYGAFLEKEYGNMSGKPGVIRDQKGEVMGEHTGYYHYTRGQRRGLGVAHKERLYVIETRPDTNEVIVGSKDDLLDQRFRVSRIGWTLVPQAPFRAQVKIRSQHQKVWAVVHPLSAQEAEVKFEVPQEAITPGQAAVFYDGPRLLGGGWIDEVFKK